MEDEEVVGDFNNVPLIAPGFTQDFECWEKDSLEAGKEFSDDNFQAGQIRQFPPHPPRQWVEVR